ncbi:unnamed protein product, partial [Cyprideis torosa]
DGSDAVLKQLEQSGLRGRGGAGFSTAMKWTFCRDACGDQHYVVCNADEGEPGTFKDRVLLNQYADTVFEGMTLCAAVVGARQGFLYLRGEYRHLVEPLSAVLQRRRDQGLLGQGILGQSGFDFDIEIQLGAGAYICGEESSLIESLEGKRGIPRNRPPFPVSQGYLQQPTVVNNVETFMAAALIAWHGGDWFAQKGTATSQGTKLLSISGDCSKPGIYEYPFGTTLEQILKDCGAVDTQAVQVAGAAGSTHPASEFHRTIAFDDISTGGSLMVFDQSRDLLQMVQNFADFFVHESCGFCTPCRVGGSLLRDLVSKVNAGYASEYDLEEMRKIGALMQQASHCGLGVTAPQSVLDTLEKFPHLYADKLAAADFVPAFDLDASLAQTRLLSGRDDAAAHLENDRVPFEAGDTVMDAAMRCGIYIPHLCHNPDFAPHGSCRVCVVTFNGREVSSCTQPAQADAVVESEVETIQQQRRSLLQMLFVEGNHVCPACEKSGACGGVSLWHAGSPFRAFLSTTAHGCLPF